jgi:SAM-dependent methyltransferase
MIVDWVRNLLKKSSPRRLDSAAVLPWHCNLCGQANATVLGEIEREHGACSACGSVMRFRSLMLALTERLHGKSTAMAALPPAKQIVGLGMSDSHTYAEHLQRLYHYTNTYYHCDPLLDITDPAAHWLGVNDFVVSSDVFEHVPPPIQPAFDHLFRLLKPGGVLVFSVPYSLEETTVEHFPDLHDFHLRQDEQGGFVLCNTTREGLQQEFRDLVFHGGPGSTLELRLFSLAALRRHLAAAGFVDVRLHDQPDHRHGIDWTLPWGVTLTALRPRA